MVYQDSRGDVGEGGRRGGTKKKRGGKKDCIKTRIIYVLQSHGYS